VRAMKNLIWLLFPILLISCEKEQELIIENSNELTGSWINQVVNDSVMEYSKAETLKDNDYGFEFKPNQVFIERKNAGWCGTPPIAYADFEGTWQRQDSILIITVDYWGGTADYKWEIISVDENSLKIYKVSEEYHNQF
jgi:hypothetical protein